MKLTFPNYIFYLRELLFGSLRKPKKSQKSEPAKVDKSDKIFWTQKPERTESRRTQNFQLVFSLLEKIGRSSWIDFVVSKFCCVSWGNKNTLFIGVIDKWKIFTAFIKAKFIRQSYPWIFVPWLLDGYLSETYSFQDLVFIEIFLRGRQISSPRVWY